MTFLDADLHPSALRPADLADLAYFGVRGALLASGEAGRPPTREAVRRGWEQLAGDALRRLRAAGLAGAAALGIHPEAIPARGLEALLAELPDHLGRPGVVAVGAVGLAAGGPREEAVLERQVALAVELRLPVVIAVGWRERARLTRRVLALLRTAGVEPGRALVAADRGTVRTVRACGYAALLTLSGGAGDPIDEAVRAVRALGPEGLCLGSGAGEGGGDLLALPRAAGRLEKAGLSAAVIRRVCGANVTRFLGVPVAV